MIWFESLRAPVQCKHKIPCTVLMIATPNNKESYIRFICNCIVNSTKLMQLNISTEIFLKFLRNALKISRFAVTDKYMFGIRGSP